MCFGGQTKFQHKIINNNGIWNSSDRVTNRQVSTQAVGLTGLEQDTKTKLLDRGMTRNLKKQNACDTRKQIQGVIGRHEIEQE